MSSATGDYDLQRWDPPLGSDWLILVITGRRQRSTIFSQIICLITHIFNIVTVSPNISNKSYTVQVKLKGSSDLIVSRVEEHLEKWSVADSSLITALCLCFCLGLGVLGFTRPCSSNISCCFRRRYSCFISSRRVFSSSLRKRSSSAFRLVQTKYKF